MAGSESLQFGLKADILVQIKSILLQNLTKKSPHFRVYIFGSRADGSQRQYSDLDLWVEIHPDLNSEELASILDQIEESYIPITVDIITSERCLPEFRKTIEDNRVLWFEV